MSQKIARTSVVCVEAELVGDIEIGERSVIHPKVIFLKKKNGSDLIFTDK